MRDDFGVGLALEHVAPGLQGGAQFVVVFDDAVVHQRHAAGRAGRRTRAVAEVRVGVVHHGRTVRGPAGVGDARAAADAIVLHLLRELGDARRAARAPQAAAVHRHTAGVVAAVLQPLQPLNQHGHHVTPGNPCHDAAHSALLEKSMLCMLYSQQGNFRSNFISC
ncbi:hypothetical protein FQZ97_927660 [compost metagenome]